MTTHRPITNRWWVAVAVVFGVLAPSGVLAQTQEDFFNDDGLHDIRLRLSSRDWQTLKAHAFENTYYPADLQWRGIVVRNIGIRSRGLGTRNGIKPGLRVDINRYISNQEFLGLKAFVLDNAYTDASLVHESVTMKVFGRIGLVAPREAHARLFVNDEYVGAYVIVEAIDRTFVTRVFGAEEGDVEDGGTLYEYRWTRPYGFEYLGPALENYAVLFEPQTRETASMFSLFQPLEQLIRLVNESSSNLFESTVGQRLDLPAFVEYLAVQNFMADIDGFVGNWGMSNFFLYRFTDNTPARVIPWDADQAFAAPALATDYNFQTNVLTARVMEVPALHQLYADTLRQVAAIASLPDAGDPRGWLEREIDRQTLQIGAAVAADPVMPFSLEQVQAEIESMRNFSRVRSSVVLGQLDGQQ
jgi:spore coat protein H